MHSAKPDNLDPMRILVLSALGALLAHAQDAIPRNQEQPTTERTVTTTDGQNLRGSVVNEGATDLQLREANGKIRLLRKADNGRYRVVTSQTDWPTYNGAPSGNRYSALTQINKLICVSVE